jgi:hypothetical protein
MKPSSLNLSKQLELMDLHNTNHPGKTFDQE